MKVTEKVSPAPPKEEPKTKEDKLKAIFEKQHLGSVYNQVAQEILDWAKPAVKTKKKK